jgi:chromatin segregation and condensation protein Rec8/ScpA/Scc1 (kleisin family)
LVGPILIEVEANMIFFIKSAFLLNTPRIEEEEEEEENG